MRAFLLGAAAGAVLAYTAAATAALVIAAADGRLRLAIGPLAVLVVESTANGSETTFGIGLALAPILGGLANVAAASVLALRAR